MFASLAMYYNVKVHFSDPLGASTCLFEEHAQGTVIVLWQCKSDSKHGRASFGSERCYHMSEDCAQHEYHTSPKLNY